jgi:hypothetical protein
MFAQAIVLRTTTCAAFLLAICGSAMGQRPLVLTGAIPLPNVQGHIDHFAFDPEGRSLFPLWATTRKK